MTPRGHRMLMALAVLAIGAGQADAAPDATALLERAFRHPRAVAHSGTLKVTVATAETPTTVRVLCDGQGRERREHLDGPTRGLVTFTDGASTWQRGQGERVWVPLPPAASGGSWERLRRSYTFRQQGTTCVVGRKAVQVAITPRHPGNPRQVLWLDTATALPLRSESYSASGKRLLATIYTALRPGDPGTLAPPSPAEVGAVMPSQRWEPCASMEEMERRVGHRMPLPADLPPGYEVTGLFLRGCRRGEQLPVVRYEDGLNALTLFVTPGRGGWGRGFGRGWRRRLGGGRPACQFDSMAGQQVVRATHAGYTYVLVGDHQPEALAAMLRSVE